MSIRAYYSTGFFLVFFIIINFMFSKDLYAYGLVQALKSIDFFIDWSPSGNCGLETILTIGKNGGFNSCIYQKKDVFEGSVNKFLFCATENILVDMDHNTLKNIDYSVLEKFAQKEEVELAPNANPGNYATLSIDFWLRDMKRYLVAVQFFHFLNYHGDPGKELFDKIYSNGPSFFKSIAKNNEVIKKNIKIFFKQTKGMFKNKNYFRAEIEKILLELTADPDEFTLNKLNQYLQIHYLTNCIINNKNQVNNLYQRALLFGKINNTDKQYDDYENILKIAPKESQAYYYRSSLYLSDSDFKKALSDIDNAIKWNTTHNNDYYFKRSEIYEKMNSIEKAIEDIEFVLEKDPNNKIANERLSSLKKK